MHEVITQFTKTQSVFCTLFLPYQKSDRICWQRCVTGLSYVPMISYLSDRPSNIARGGRSRKRISIQNGRPNCPCNVSATHATARLDLGKVWLRFSDESSDRDWPLFSSHRVTETQPIFNVDIFYLWSVFCLESIKFSGRSTQPCRLLENDFGHTAGADESVAGAVSNFIDVINFHPGNIDFSAVSSQFRSHLILCLLRIKSLPQFPRSS